MARVTLIWSPHVKLHIPPRRSGHVEEPARIDRALRALKSTRLLGGVVSEEAVEPGALPWALRFYQEVHDVVYLEEVRSEVEAALDSYFIDSDTYLSPGSGEAIAALATMARRALEIILEGGTSRVFILSRPPGHHAGIAGPGLGAPSLGGCIVNTAAAIAVKLARSGRRTLIVDFDLHHGNGTQEIVQAFPENLYMVDVHQDWRRTFPWTGEPGSAGEGNVLNVNVPVGAGDDIYAAVAEGLEGLIDELAPDAVVASAGFNPYRQDTPLTGTRATSNTFHRLAEALTRAEPLVAVLEGGYTRGLEKGLPAFLAGLAGEDDPIRDDWVGSSEETWRQFEELNKEAIETGE